VGASRYQIKSRNTHVDANADKKLVEEFSKIKGKKTLPFNTESDLTDYLQLYADLAK
jgi:hypothetical protein